MGSTVLNEIITSEEFDKFYHSAQGFTAFVEEEFTIHSNDYLKQLQDKLLVLYETAMNVPWIDLKSYEDDERRINNSYFEKILVSIAENLQDKRHYWDISNPTSFDCKHELVAKNLVEDVGNIFKNIKYSLNIFNSGKPNCEEVALWQFKFDFEYHWGSNCINAIRAIHFYLLK